MPVNITDLTPLVYDPARAQQMILSNIKNHQINEPTNPFIMLVEAATTLAAAASTEATSTLRRMYPSLANTAKDILPHVTDNDLINVFSYPSETSMVFYLNVRDIRSNGHYVTGLGHFETIIPAGTVVRVTKIPFTLLNDIVVKLYDTGVVFAEQITSTARAANNSLGILAAGIVNFQDGEPWIAIETTLKQLNKSTIIKTLTVSEGFELSVKHTDKYYYSDVYFKDSTTDGLWVPLVVTHSDTYINPAVPAVSILAIDNLVTYIIPDVYLISGQIGGEIKIVLYETRGYLDLPIYKYNMSEYTVELSAITADPIKATINNITIYANSRAVVNGGKTGYSFEELRTSVIYNTLGHETLPVTEAQLTKAASKQGFELHKIMDMVTERVFVATRSIVRYDSQLIYTRPDLFFNTVSLDLTTVSNTKIITAPTYAMIPSGTVFKEDNSIISIVNDQELTLIAGLTNLELIDYLKTNKLFFTPYYYVIDTTDASIIDTSVYDLDTPELRDIRITGKNVNIVERVNVGKYGLYKTSTGYDLIIDILGNTEFDNTNTNLLHGQLKIDMFGGDSVIYFEGIYDINTKLMTFKIDTNFNITQTETLEITNGTTAISNPYIGLATLGTLTLYSSDTNITDNTNYLLSEIGLPYTTAVVFDREDIYITFGRTVKYIWNKVFTTYTDRKYLKYAVDKPLMYKQDVYDIDPLTGSIITVVTDQAGVKQTVKTLLHAAGDPVLDNQGLPVYEYRTGDVILDANSLPTIDLIGGVVRHADILMLEYEYLAASTTVGKNYLGVITDTINSWLFTSIPTLNKAILENTKLLYKSYKKAEPVEIVTESIIAQVPYTIKPTVILYSRRDNYTTDEMSNLHTEIGYLIHSYLDKANINLVELKNEITTTIDNSIVGVKVENIETYRNSVIFSLRSPLVRLALGKKLIVNTNNELVVNYDIIIKVHKV